MGAVLLLWREKRQPNPEAAMTRLVTMLMVMLRIVMGMGYGNGWRWE